MPFKALFSKLPLPGRLQHTAGAGEGLRKATEEQLFTRTRPDVDGDDCQSTCQGCPTKYPRKFDVNTSDHVYGNINAWDQHLIVATGKTDWIRDVDDIEHSVMAAVSKHASKITTGKLKVSASNMPVPDETTAADTAEAVTTRCILLPAFVYIDHVSPANTPLLISELINTTATISTPLTPIRPPSPPTPVLQPSPPTTSPFTVTPCPHDYLIFLCSHRTRDARCGQSAPLLRKEFERHLRPRGLLRDLHDERPGGVGIYYINHVGGHKYAANVLIYRRAGMVGAEVPAENGRAETVGDASENGGSGAASDVSEDGLVAAVSATTITEGTAAETTVAAESAEEKQAPTMEAAQCIWLARIYPEDCENVIKYTVLQGKVVRPDVQLRGGFDRCKQLASW